MRTFNHILFPVDFSDRSEAARPVVAYWARRFHSRVTLFHTIQIPISAYGGADGYPIIVDVPQIEGTAKDRLDQVAMDIPVTSRIVKTGDPAFEIIQYAGKNDVDLIMMPTHGYGKFRSLLLGSVAAKVLHDAHCPVWTSAHLEDLPGEQRTEIRSILCAISEGPGGGKLIREASELAAACGSTLRLVRAVPVEEMHPHLEVDFEAALIRMNRDEIAVLQQHEGTDLGSSVHVGTVSHVVRDAAKEYDADLVVIGRGKLHEAFGRLRSNAYAIIRDSPCAVLSI
jgi:nucleotide-binding universal stress UspA family protein